MEKLYSFLLLSSACLLPYGELTGQSFELLKSFEQVSVIEDANGVAVADYDQDGDLDVFIVSIHRYEAGNRQSWSRLLQNNGDNQFKDVTRESNLFAPNYSLRSGWMGDRMSASWGDYDNDGYPDLFLANNGEDELWHNEGNGQFRNVTEEAGVKGCYDCYSSNGLWWDFDLDGDLDLYVSDWLKKNRHYRNEGNGKFVDLSIESGLNDTSKTWASIPLDVNGDVLPDLYVVNDFGANFLFLNLGDGTFEEATGAYGLEDDGDGMGVDICDFNHDGRFDIYVTNIFRHRPNPFFVGQEDGMYVDKAKSVGIEDTGWGWGARFFDADHDMDEDLYVVNGMTLSAGRGDENVFFEQIKGKFHNISRSLGVNNAAIARGLEVFDSDLDGDLDMLVGNRAAKLSFYQNTLIETHTEGSNWIQFTLESTTANKDALGASVRITCENTHYYRYHSGANLFGQSIKPIHFGLGNNLAVAEVEVTWPKGNKEYFPYLEANQLIHLLEGSGNQESSLVLTPDAADLQRTKVYPTPFDRQLNIQVEERDIGWIDFRLMDLRGKVVLLDKRWMPEPGTMSINVLENTLREGVYIYQLSTLRAIKTGKLIKTQ